jgi:hypothetical protein
VNSTDDFTITIRRDYFPYFAQGKSITITGLELYNGKDVSKHHAIGDQVVWGAATTDLDNNQAFTFTAETNQVLTRMASAQIFLIVRYALGACEKTMHRRVHKLFRVYRPGKRGAYR